MNVGPVTRDRVGGTDPDGTGGQQVNIRRHLAIAAGGDLNRVARQRGFTG